MSTIKPIPRKLLIHDIKYQKLTDGNDWDDRPVYDEPVLIKRVRVEYKSQFSQSGNAENVMYDAQIFIDQRNSDHKDIDFVENSKVTFEGTDFYIKEVEKVYGLQHHHTVLKVM